jgi:butyrate kinase
MTTKEPHFREVVLVINPGSTSTKVALYSREGCIISENITHRQADLDRFERVTDQLEFRYNDLKNKLLNLNTLEGFRVIGVSGRGGIVKPLEGGTYRINEAFLADAASGRYGDHASNLGSLLAERMRKEYGLPECYTVDPVSVGNMRPEAEISGVPEITRVGRGHPLNMKMTARKVAKLQGIDYEDSNYIIAHLGGGISIAHVQAGKILDINDALLGMGPFSPNRAGALPLRGLMRLCYQMTENEIVDKLSRKSGFKAYLGTEDLREVILRSDLGDEKSGLIYRAFVYQVAKEIGSYFAASGCRAQGIIITGGIANNVRFTDDLKEYIGKLGEIFLYPGENEMEALAEGVFRVLDGIEVAQEY